MYRLTTVIAAAAVTAGLLAAPGTGGPRDRGGSVGGELGAAASGAGKLASFQARGGTVIRLLAGSFDPRSDALPAPRGIALRDAARLPAATPQYWLVQVRDQRFPEALRAVDDAGGAVAGTIPEDTYLVRATPAQRAQIARSPAVRWTGYYQPAWRVPAAAAGKPGLMDLPGEQTYHVYAFRNDPRAGSLGRALDAIEGVELVSGGGAVYEVRATAAQVPAIAALPAVEWVTVEAEVVPLNANARWVNDTGIRDLYAATADGRLNGAGQTAAVADTGLNYTYDLNGRAHVGFRDCNADGTGCKTAVYTQVTPGTAANQLTNVQDNGTGHRKMVAYFDLGNTGTNMYDPSSHGTHVAGSVNGDQPPYDRYTGEDGLAPAARHVHQNIASAAGGLVLPADTYLLWRQAYRPRNPGSVAIGSTANGNPTDYTTNYRPLEDARTHNNSYGLGVPVADTGRAEHLDRFVWDHEDMTIVVSAGNGGPGLATISSPSVAKNNLSSGASANGRQPMVSIDSMASFSSHGPTGDGRFGPDLATPGQIVVSAKGGSNDGYHVAQGTSMSGPILTGLATLVRQYFHDGYAAAGGDGFAAGSPDASRRHNPSAALVKAALINGAVRMRGWYTGDDGRVRAQDGQWPSAGQGFGRVSLDNSLYFENDPTNNWYVDVYRGDGGNANPSLRPFTTSALAATRTFTLRVAPGQPFDVSLAWTDPPTGLAAGTPALVNNLDLTVTGPNGLVYVGNNMNSRAVPAVDVAETLPGPAPADVRNNAERVRIANPQAGTYTITVTAPALITGNQGFALAASGNISPAGGPPFQPGPPLQVDEPGAPAISNVRIQTLSADTAKVTFDTSEPTTATAELPIGGTPTTFVDSYNAGPGGFPGLNAGAVETSAEYANKAVVGRKHEILVTGLAPGQEATVTLRARDLAETPNEATATAALRSPTSVFQADAPDIGQLYEDPQSATASGWRTTTQLYASDPGNGTAALGAFGFRIPAGAVDPATIDAAVVELTSSHNWVVPYTSDPVYNVDLLGDGVEPLWGTQLYGDIKSAPAAARVAPETTYRRGAYAKYAFTLRCSDLPALRSTVGGPGSQLAAFRWESSVDPVAGYFSMEFGFNRRSRGPEMRPKLMLFTAGQSGYPDGRPCDPSTPAPTVSEVGIHGGNSPDSITVTWETDVPSDSMVVFRERGASEWTQVASPALTTVHQVQVFGLDPFAQYEFAVRSTACNGATTTDANGGQGYHFFRTVDLGSPTTHAGFDFESGAQGWTTAATTTNVLGIPSPWVRRADGAGGTATGWHIAFDGGPLNSYGDLSESTLTSPPVTFTGRTAAARFHIARHLEDTFDFLYVEYSADGGATWTTAARYDGLNPEYPGFEPAAREVRFEHPNPGGQLQLRFRFRSDDFVSTPPYLGVSVDEVTLLSYPNAATGGGESLPTSGPVPPPSAGATGLTPPPTRTGPASAADIAAGTGYCTIPGGGGPGEGADAATGGGWLADRDGKKLNFGFSVARASSGALEGSLQFQDKARSVKVDLARVTSLAEGPWGANSLAFEGAGTFNGAPASFRVSVQDNGSGKKAAARDRFLLECVAGCTYTSDRDGADDEIDGGNIDVKRASQPAAAGQPAPSTMTLGPLLASEAAVGSTQTFVVKVYDQNQRALSNVPVTLTRTTAGGAVVSLTAVTGLTGTVAIPMLSVAELAEYRATAGGAGSNTVELTPLGG